MGQGERSRRGGGNGRWGWLRGHASGGADEAGVEGLVEEDAAGGGGDDPDMHPPSIKEVGRKAASARNEGRVDCASEVSKAFMANMGMHHETINSR